jgi:hypothetical protein
MDMATAIGIELLTEEEYFGLQKLGEFDRKTLNWMKTPADIRERGGALYGERRYDRIFVEHNGAQSYYAVTGFRGSLESECLLPPRLQPGRVDSIPLRFPENAALWNGWICLRTDVNVRGAHETSVRRGPALFAEAV